MTEWTLCWRCDQQYVVELFCCPKCKAANANTDPAAAEREMRAEIDRQYPPETLA